MRALRILLRHRITRWLRNPSWGTGTVAGQVVLLGLLLLLLAPLGLGSYALGDVLRELYPNADALALINGGMLYLVPVLTAGRFLLQAPPSEQVASYAALPVSRRGLLNGQALLSLLSVHTVFAIVLVVPVWAAEVATAWSSVAAGAWLATALLLTVVLASHGAILLHLLLGRRPWGFVGALVLGSSVAAADAILGPGLFRAASRFIFGQPLVGLACTALLTTGLHTGLLRAMRDRLEVDRRTMRRRDGPAWWEKALCRWAERTLPAGRLVALELRQIIRTRRLRGLFLSGLVAIVYFDGIALATAEQTVEAADLFNIVLFGIGGPAFGLGFWLFGAWAGYADGLLARPHALSDIVRAKLVLLWIALLPGSLGLLVLLPWLSGSHAAFLGALLLCWAGVIVPGFLYIGPHFRTPVDTSASMFTMNTNFHGLRYLPLLFLLFAISLVALLLDAWWGTAAVVAVASTGALLGVLWTVRPFARQLNQHRREMLEGFRENEPI